MIDQSSDSRTAREMTSYTYVYYKFSKICVFAYSFVGFPIFLDIAACFSASKSNSKSPPRNPYCIYYSYWRKECIESTCNL